MSRPFAPPAIPLSTFDPTAPLDDLEPLARLIPEHTRVVAIGESAHGAHEFYALRHRLIRFLVERMNFTAVAWESGFPEAFLVDDFLRGGGPHDRDHVLADGMTMHMGRCREMADLVDWLRAHNAARPRPVRFYGLDLPGSAATLRPSLDAIAPYVETVDPGFHSRLARLQQLAAAFGPPAESKPPDKLFLVGTTIIQQYVAMPTADRNELTTLLAELAARFDALRRTYVERSDAQRYDLARQHLRVATQLDLQFRAVATFMSGDTAACEANIRDLAMADTVEWVLRHHERILVLAHNGHIQKTPIATPAGPIDTLGVHLAHRLTDQYVTIGTPCGAGDIIVPRTATIDGVQQTELVIRTLPPAPDDTVDHLLDATLSGPALVDLRTLDSTNAAAVAATKRMRVLDQFTELDVRRAFDLLIHVPRISLWTSPTTARMPDLRAPSTPTP